jgi:hypothetical protein
MVIRPAVLELKHANRETEFSCTFLDPTSVDPRIVAEVHKTKVQNLWIELACPQTKSI